ncbi:MAG: hypothetical protein FWE13_06600 [Firmicutes bacterium]|nr:hypothetical protein [Bacillota bacterium]
MVGNFVFNTIAKSVTVSFLILGAILGAGFASGRELISFFGLGISPLAISVIVAILIFSVSSLFLWIGSKLNVKKVSQVNFALVGRFHFITDAVLLVNSLIVLSAMLGATNSLGATTIGFNSPIYAVVLVVACALLSLKGAKGLTTANKIVVPFMVILIVIIAGIVLFNSSNSTDYTLEAGSIWQAIVFVCMNMLLASTVVTTIGQLDKKTIFVSSAITAIIMGVLVFVVLSALNARGDIVSDMPVLSMAREIHIIIYWLMVVMLAAGIFTTMLTAMLGLVAWLEPILGSKKFSATTVSVLAFILSNLGFATVVRVLYPIIGIFGVVYTLIAIVFVIRMGVIKRKSASKILLAPVILR